MPQPNDVSVEELVRRRRPGGRSTRVRRAVLNAAQELLFEGGSEAVTMAALAERSKVHRTSIYRRWVSVEGVLADLAVEAALTEWPRSETGDLRQDLENLAQTVIDSLGQGTEETQSLVRRLLSWHPGSESEQRARETQLDLLVVRASELQDWLDRAADGGEPRITVGQLIDFVLAPIYFRSLLSPMFIPEGYTTQLVDRLFSQTAPQSASPTEAAKQSRRPAATSRHLDS